MGLEKGTQGGIRMVTALFLIPALVIGDIRLRWMIRHDHKG
jgi:hypothetical protein